MKIRKGAPVMKIVSLVMLLVVVSAFLLLWWIDGTKPADRNDSSPIPFTISQGESIKSITSRLSQAGLIRSPTAFYILVRVRGLERSLQAGDFRLRKDMGTEALASELTHGMTDTWVTVVEGLRDEEIASVYAKTLDIPETEFLKHSRIGYMFPDTYRFPQTATAETVTSVMMTNFSDKISDQTLAKGASYGLSPEEVVTLASLIEREGRSRDDRRMIAGILIRRLQSGWPLQVDATLQYALGYQAAEKTWWKKALTNADKEFDSPYNTYANTGLPPGPIANPGLESLLAAVEPIESDYWYYIHDPQGGVHYARTLEEHNANIAAYLR